MSRKRTVTLTFNGDLLIGERTKAIHTKYKSEFGSADELADALVKFPVAVEVLASMGQLNTQAMEDFMVMTIEDITETPMKLGISCGKWQALTTNYVIHDDWWITP